MNNIKKYLSHSISLFETIGAIFMIAVCAAIVFCAASPPHVSAQGNPLGAVDIKTPNVRTLAVQPAKSTPTTNGAIFYDHTGTNYFRIPATNGASGPTFHLRAGGVLYTGVTATVTFTAGTNVAANGGSNTFTFKNGLLVNGP